MSWNVGDVFTYPPITSVTVNDVVLHPAAGAFLLVSLAVVFAAGIAVFFRRSPSLGAAARKAALIAVFVCGLLAAAHADIGWSEWLSRDADAMSGLSVEQKLAVIDGGLFVFTRLARQVVPGDYVLFAGDPFQAQRAEYLLLPLRKRQEAQYLVVLADPGAGYDQTRRIFTRGDLRLENVDLVLYFAPRVMILKKP